jgi:hypothetical protein
VGLAVRQIAWGAANGAVLGAVVAPSGALVTAPHILLNWVLSILGGVFLGLFRGIMAGTATAAVHVAVVALLPVARHPRLYRWGMSLLGALIGLGIMRLTIAAVFFFGRGGDGDGWHWALGWSLDEYPTSTAFLTVVVLPTLLVGLGTWWATRRVAAWYVRVPLRYLPIETVSPPARRDA